MRLMLLLIALRGTIIHDRIGFRYWVRPDPMKMYLEIGLLGCSPAYWKVFIQATFRYGGSEMVVVAAGEAGNHGHNISKTVHSCLFFLWANCHFVWEAYF